MNNASNSAGYDTAIQTLSVRDLHVAHKGQHVLRGVSFAANVGEVCAVMGVSGAGKTTILRAIAALQSFNKGSIAVDGVSLAAGPVPPESQLKELRRRVGVVFQHNALFQHLSVIDNVTLAPIHALGWPNVKAREVAMDLLGSLGVRERAAAFPGQLSGGEAQRVAIARALAPNPLVLLMDEPTSALDPARRGALGELLRSLAGAGRAIVIVTHDVDFAKACADRVVVIDNGLVTESGLAHEVLAKH
ncbi:MAG: amino acid ABC transporter ATP-binding protein [Phycisphaerae bacterium]|nr:amino acid ABC transporter ATP-binding protein [Gemmatimonadaceae bacterium]